jgi:hypothetical protein
MKKYQFFAAAMITVFCMACQSRPVVYDRSVPAEKSSTLYIYGALSVKQFDGKLVFWGKRDVVIPGGPHEFIVDYYNEYPSGEPRGVIHSARGITVAYNFAEGRSYYMKAEEEKGRFFNEKLVFIVIEDITLEKAKEEAEKKEKARQEANKAPVPRPSSEPTLLEGIWKGQDGRLYTFSGNSWRRGYNKGLFIIDGDVLKIYTLYIDRDGNDKWKKWEYYSEHLFTLKEDGGVLELTSKLTGKTETYSKQ